jgi:hypothetical protein
MTTASEYPQGYQGRQTAKRQIRVERWGKRLGERCKQGERRH